MCQRKIIRLLLSHLNIYKTIKFLLLHSFFIFSILCHRLMSDTPYRLPEKKSRYLEIHISTIGECTMSIFCFQMWSFWNDCKKCKFSSYFLLIFPQNLGSINLEFFLIITILHKLFLSFWNHKTNPGSSRQGTFLIFTFWLNLKIWLWKAGIKTASF